ncbi:ArsR/SmtB family transcription factor [Nocardia flavorosea]|uniref:ArsR/SmtB family transcription factor n=1 Tax=Nocardia flavorosea TaxID=53429 RepID=UPI000A61818B|nr:metalloregulator ArsR/SmtB family transcription factor [Nocardia flavorosea]
MVRTTPPDYRDLAEVELAEVMHALADPVRLGLIRLLSNGDEVAWGQLDVPVAPSTLSYHLKVLRSAGLTRTRKEGTRCFVHLRTTEVDQIFPGLLDTTLTLMAHTPGGIVPVKLKSENRTGEPACRLAG